MPIVGGVPTGQRLITLGSLAFFNDPTPGVHWKGLRLQGWDGGPGSSLQLDQKLLAPGGWRSSNPQLATRALTLTGMIVGATPDVVVAAADRLKAAATLEESLLQVDGDGVGLRTALVSRSGEVLVENTQTQLVKTFSVGLVAADPRKFGTPITLSTNLPATTGGLTVPFTVPFTIAATTVTGQVSATNPGNIDGPVTVRVSGPVDSPIVAHVGPDGTVDTFAISLSLGAGEWVDIDMEARTVLAQGQSSRAQWVTSRGWAGFKPGLNTWAFTNAGAYSSGASMSVTATPAWE